MKLFEMEGFLRGKCIPRDLKVNETNAEYLVRKFAEADAMCAALAAEKEKFAVECAATKIAIAYLKSGRHDFTLNTPATDAFLAEVRAQVWIEGNEPAEFGRYWVRYETDVGPRYCSAQWMEHNFCAGSDTNIHRIWLADHSRSINSLRGVTHYTKLPDSLEAAQ
ncbi:hypothetical protein [Enterobacter intestinihominis]|uniref:hypothetical protein n=1 Tax=Enterobacter intestinihominis TaxID=3133180 RepID=UPI003B24C533